MFRGPGGSGIEQSSLIFFVTELLYSVLEKEDDMAVSARNQLKGVVQTMIKGDVMAEVTIDVGSGNTIVAVITRQSAETLHIKPGDQVTAVIKATEVMVAKE